MRFQTSFFQCVYKPVPTPTGLHRHCGARRQCLQKFPQLPLVVFHSHGNPRLALFIHRDENRISLMGVATDILFHSCSTFFLCLSSTAFSFTRNARVLQRSHTITNKGNIFRPSPSPRLPSDEVHTRSHTRPPKTR